MSSGKTNWLYILLKTSEKSALNIAAETKNLSGQKMAYSNRSDWIYKKSDLNNRILSYMKIVYVPHYTVTTVNG